MEKSGDLIGQNSFPPAVQLFEMVNGFMRTQAIYAAAKLGIADFLLDGTQGIDQLAVRTGADKDSLYRLLRTLASMGIFEEHKNKVFKLTPMAAPMLSDISASLRPYILLVGDKSWWTAWGNLLYSVKTGKAAFDHLFGMGYTKYLEKNTEIGKIFNECMTSVSQVNNPAILDGYDFSCFNKIADIGGGHGSLLIEILKQYPKVNGVLFDLPHVINSFTGFETGIAERCELLRGNFFEKVPSACDGYILKQIIHDWNDNRAKKILQNCRREIKKDGRLLIVDAVIDSGNQQTINKLFDLHMLVTADGGKERSESQFRSLLRSSKFELLRIIKTNSSLCIIEAKPV